MNEYTKEQIAKEIRQKELENSFFSAIEKAPESVKAMPPHYKKVVDFLAAATPAGCRCNISKTNRIGLLVTIDYIERNYAVTYSFKKPLADFSPKYNYIPTTEEIESEYIKAMKGLYAIKKDAETLRNEIGIDAIKDLIRL